eukprot:TRINITY_DN2229_c0_g1_i1.p1 TRINITY_DN2229_c0_g1~~TRINITY_DN2229_c0_g1_i1.p1  ORF type:complete len:210 (-),score=25.61 TRINITY_DN2229_c0_g1_i1:147-725(-)
MSQTLQRSRSEGMPKRKKFPLVHAPDAWEKGWMSHPNTHSGPRWSMPRGNFNTERTIRPAFGGSHRDRDTWIQSAVRAKQWVPGPGAYKAEREFMLEPKDDVDTNITIQEAAPEYSFQRQKYETSQEVKDVAPKRNDGVYPKFDPHFTPGPGSYMQYTCFGSHSGGHRQSYMGGSSHKNQERVLGRTWAKAG